LIIEAVVVILAASMLTDLVAAMRPGFARAGRVQVAQARAGGAARTGS